MSNERSAAHDPWPELKKAWAIHEDEAVSKAVQDPKFQAIFHVFAIHKFDPIVVELVKDNVEIEIEERYGVPRHRSQEVFETIEIIVRQEIDSNGHA